MASSNKKVSLEVAIKTQEEKLEQLDKELANVKRKANELSINKIQMKVDADTSKLKDINTQIRTVESELKTLKGKADVDDSEVKELESKLQSLKNQRINVQADLDQSKLQLTQKTIEMEVSVEKSALDEVQSRKDEIEADEINVQLNNQTAMQGLQQIADGFSRIKSAASEVGQQFGDLLASAGKQETNFAFLKNAVGDAELARQKMSEINDIVAQLPGDDTALQGLLSSAAAKDSSLTAENLKSMANSATDYFSAMSYYGKSATEAQQDMTNYLLAGNTAELERSPILQGHIDKLKEATTVQERSKALAEALNEEHWGGMGAMDTYNNKLETFNGMLERGRYTLGGMFQEGAKNAMDFILKLDEGTNGLVGMGIAAASFASPLSDMLIGIGQVGTGLKSLKDAADFLSITDKVRGFINTLKSLEITSRLAAAAQAFLNLIMSMNPVMLVVIAITALIAVLAYLYFTNEDVRNTINGLGQDLWGVGETIYGYLLGAFQAIQDAFNGVVNFFQTYGPLISEILFVMATGGIGAILLLIGQFNGMPSTIGGILQNIIGRITSFVGSMVSNFVSGATRSVNGFINKIKEMPSKFASELQNMIQQAIDFANRIVQIIADAAARMVKFWEWGSGEHSPGFMHDDFVGEIKAMENAGSNLKLADIMGKSAHDMVKSWGNPSLSYSIEGTRELSNEGNAFSLSEIVNLLGSLLDALRGNDKGSINNTFVLNGDMDSEDRMRKFIDAIVREMDWDNATAGRTIDTIESG